MSDNKTTSLRSLILMIGSVAALAGTLSARAVVVTGNGDPNVDVPAVQGAVDHGGSVILRGQFSFDRPPTAPAGAIYKRMVTLSRSVVISGGRDAGGGLPTIAGGEWPFLVENFTRLPCSRMEPS
ncbi:MAG: hypothetical protein M3Y27_25925 [Acidobacteriota bacterium]|nr:hypothetical protein [Acidobacteriota bacterium]